MKTRKFIFRAVPEVAASLKVGDRFPFNLGKSQATHEATVVALDGDCITLELDEAIEIPERVGPFGFGSASVISAAVDHAKAK